MTTFRVYYNCRGCVYFTPPYVEVTAATEMGAKEIFHQTRSRADYFVTLVERQGLYNNNGRYSIYFTATKPRYIP